VGELGGAEALGLFLRWMASETLEPELWMAMRVSFGELGVDCGPALREQSQSLNLNSRIRAIEALAIAGLDTSEAFVDEVMARDEPNDRMAAAWARLMLVATGAARVKDADVDAARSMLSAYAGDQNPELALEAYCRRASLGDVSALDQVMGRLAVPELRARAKTCLAGLPVQLRPLVASAMERDAQLTSTALDLIGVYQLGQFRDEVAGHLSGEIAIQAAAGVALARMGDARGVAHLRSLRAQGHIAAVREVTGGLWDPLPPAVVAVLA